MFKAQLVIQSKIDLAFGATVEAAFGVNPGGSNWVQTLQNFSPVPANKAGNFLFLGILCAGYHEDIEHVLSKPTNLQCLLGDAPPRCQGALVLMTGTAAQWDAAIQGWEDPIMENWANTIYQLMRTESLDSFFTPQQKRLQ